MKICQTDIKCGSTSIVPVRMQRCVRLGNEIRRKTLDHIKSRFAFKYHHAKSTLHCIKVKKGFQPIIIIEYFDVTLKNLMLLFLLVVLVLLVRVARADIFGWSQSRFLGLASAPTPTPTRL